MFRIIIEDQKGLHQAILNETEESKEILHNMNNLLKMSDLTDYIIIIDKKNENGCDVSVRGNDIKLTQLYDTLTSILISKFPSVMKLVTSIWWNGEGAVHD